MIARIHLTGVHIVERYIHIHHGREGHASREDHGIRDSAKNVVTFYGELDFGEQRRTKFGKQDKWTRCSRTEEIYMIT